MFYETLPILKKRYGSCQCWWWQPCCPADITVLIILHLGVRLQKSPQNGRR